MAEPFEDLIAPLSCSEFRRVHGTRALHLKGEPSRFSGLVTYQSLNTALGAMHHPSPLVRVIKDNIYLQYETADDLVRHLAVGATLIVNKIHVQLPEVRAIMNVIGGFNRANTEVNFYLSQPGVGGFGVHYDTHDVYILQVSGSKNWRVFEPTVHHPLFEMKEHDRVPPKTDPYLTVTIQAGDVLYIPRGHWHDAFAQDETSIHLTVGVSNPTGIDFLTWLTGELTESVLWREPLGFNPEDHYQQLARHLRAALADEGLIQRFMEQHTARILRDTPITLPHQLGPNQPTTLPVDAAVKKRVTFSQWKDTETTVELAFHGKILSFDRVAATLIKSAVAGEVIQLSGGSEHRFGLARHQFEKLMRHLLAEGYVAIIEKSAPVIHYGNPTF